MKTQIKALKLELKALSKEITTAKAAYKQAQRTGQSIWNIRIPSSDFRHKHIVYCLLRGRTIEQIENTGVRCPPGTKCSYACNCPNMTYVNQMIKELQDEALRGSAVGPVEVSTSGASGTCPSGCVDPAPSESPRVEQPNASVPESKGPSLFDKLARYLR